MAVAELKMYFDNQPGKAWQLELFTEIRVDQAIGIAAEAELIMIMGTDKAGVWSGFDEPFTQAFQRIRIEVKVQNGAFSPLIDGLIVAQKYELDSAPNRSRLTLVVQDDSLLLSREEKVTLFENQSPDDIATQLFQDAGLNTDVQSVPLASDGTDRYVVQRGSAMQLLKELARRHSLFVYVKPDSTPGQSIGVFKPLALTQSSFPELLLMGEKRNINKFTAQFDALRPTQAVAAQVDINSREILSSTATQSTQDTQGDITAHEATDAATTLLSRIRETREDLDAATAATANHSSWAYSASTEVRADNYAAVLSPWQMITVAGAGQHLSGQWLISRVTHVINDEGYRQQLTLRRNARSDGSASLVASLANSIGSIL